MTWKQGQRSRWKTIQGLRLGFRVRVRVSVQAAALASIFFSSAFAATKSMECQRFTEISPGQSRENNFVFKVDADYDASILRINLEIEPKEKETLRFPIALGEWKILWHSKDDLRAVAVITGFSDNPFAEPVQMVDADFAKVRISFRETGHFQEFASLDREAWQYECKRLD